MSGTKAVIAVCLIFFFGCITGAAIVVFTVDHHIHHMVAGGPGTLSEMIVDRMSRDLDLKDGQREKIQRIVEDTQGKMEAVRSQIDPQITKLMEDSKTAIRAVLTPDQASKFDKIAIRIPSRMPPPHGGWGPHPDGPPPHGEWGPHHDGPPPSF